MIKIRITDDFDLEKIVNSGQCFRAQQLNKNQFEFMTRDNILRINKLSEGNFKLSCSYDEFNQIWYNYFDLDRDYNSLIKETDNSFINDAINYGKGIRILKQDPWETLISFIISQNKNIPAIKNSIKLLSERYGSPLIFQNKTYYSFPTAKELIHVTESDLNQLKLGYRSKYIIDAIEKINSGEVDLNKIGSLSNPELLEELIKIKGVGPKVAHCVGLFAYNRISMVPQDVWIKRTIKEEFNGINYFEESGEIAGIIQQYIFYYQRNRNKKSS